MSKFCIIWTFSILYNVLLFFFRGSLVLFQLSSQGGISQREENYLQFKLVNIWFLQINWKSLFTNPTMSCRAVKSYKLKFSRVSQQTVGSNPGSITCVYGWAVEIFQPNVIWLSHLIMGLNLGGDTRVYGWAVESFEFKFWRLIHQIVGSNPGSNTCVYNDLTVERALNADSDLRFVRIFHRFPKLQNKVWEEYHGCLWQETPGLILNSGEGRAGQSLPRNEKGIWNCTGT